MMRTWVTALASVSLLAAAPAFGATAGTVVDDERRWVVYDAGPGEVNRLVIETSIGGSAVRLTDSGAAISVGEGCELDDQGRAVCRIRPRVRLVQADLGDGDDRANANGATVRAPQVNIVGGEGDDFLRGTGPIRFNFGGREGEDTLIGSNGPDVFRGGPGHDRMSSRGGDDLLIGDSGRDVLRAGLGIDRLFGGADGDKLDARDAPPAQDDVVSCGGGDDLTTADRADRPKTVGCEIFKVSPPT
jgi:Ca2+-binding RTX toxin-like protein